MADKLQQGINVLTTFVEGETPSAQKLNSITAQLRNASQQLEHAVGDIHNQSYPYSSDTADTLTPAYGRTAEATAATGASTRPLDIATIARLIGPASALNPTVVEGTLQVTEEVPPGVNEFSLAYPPESILTVTFTDTTGGSAAFVNRKISAASMNSNGDFFVDLKGRVFTTRPTRSVPDNGTVTYTTNREAWKGGNQYLGSRFNVIPGPNQLSAGGVGCAVGAPDASGAREITTPILSTAQFNEDMTAAALSDADPSYQEQLVLPLAITASYGAGEVIPQGFIYLKNWTTGQVYDEATYTYVSPTAVEISVTDITTEVDRGDVFALITVGTDITTSIDDLRRKMRHGHDRAFGEPLVPATALADFTAGPWGAQGSFTKSAIEGNMAPQYLHRYGYQSGEGEYNDHNIMRGDLVIGKSSASPGNYLTSSSGALGDDTYKLAFGHPSRSYLYEDQTLATLNMVAQAAGIGLYANGGILKLAGNTGIDADVVAGDIDFLTAEGDIELSADANGSTSKGDITLNATGGGIFQNIDSNSSAAILTNKSSSPGTGTALGGRIINLGRSWHFGQKVGVATVNFTTDYDYIAGVGNTREFTVEMEGQSTDTVTTAVMTSHDDAHGILELHCDGSNSTNNFHFIEFTDDSDGTVGSIRGVTAVSDEVFVSRDGSTFSFAAKTTVVSPASNPVASLKTGQIKFVSGSADYAEWLVAGNPTEWTDYRNYHLKVVDRIGLPEGLIVYVREGAFWRDGPGTPMVVTNRAIVLGNQKEGRWDPEDCEALSFIGQVPVAVVGSVKSGDYLIPHPDEPSFAIAVNPDECTFAQYRNAVGTAWESSEEEELKRVLCAIGKK